jgi:hypothetical protein
MHPSDVLSLRALNRSLLERQGLLRRSDRSPAETIEHLVGMQAQMPRDPYVGLWTRLTDFRPEQLSQLITGRRAVRASLMRGTIHLATGRDALTLRQFVQPVFERAFSSSPWGKNVDGVDLAALVDAGRSLVEERPRSRAQLAPLLEERFPGHDPLSLSYAITFLLPLVQVPPRGEWGKTGQATWTTLDSWMGRQLAARSSPTKLVMRYLIAFGPASPADMRTWSGVAGLTAVFERMRPRLRTFRTEQGRELFDVPGAPFPDPETRAPTRFLPEYDNVLLSHVDRSRVVSAFPREPRFWKGSVLVDGFVRGSWKMEVQRDDATLLIDPLVRRLTKREISTVTAEGLRLLAFLTDGVRGDVRILPSD